MLPNAEIRKSTRKVTKTIEVDEEVIEGVTLHLDHEQAKLLHLLTGSIHGEGSLGVWKALDIVLGKQNREYGRPGETYNGEPIFIRTSDFILTGTSPGFWRRQNVK